MWPSSVFALLRVHEDEQKKLHCRRCEQQRLRPKGLGRIKILLDDRKIENIPKSLGNNGQIKFPVFLLQVSNYASSSRRVAQPALNLTSYPFLHIQPSNDSLRRRRDQNKENATLYIYIWLTNTLQGFSLWMTCLVVGRRTKDRPVVMRWCRRRVPQQIHVCPPLLLGWHSA